MSQKIQIALGRNAKTSHPDIFNHSATYPEVGQAVVDSMNDYITWGLDHDDGSDLVQSIHSPNLKRSALFSARSARMAYLLGKATILDSQTRKGVVRNQVIEYGAVAEAILLDVVQAIGKKNSPVVQRALTDKFGTAIDWTGDALLKRKTPGSAKMQHIYDFNWLITEAKRVNVIDVNLNARITWLRESRNLVHPVLPTSQRYSDDLDSSKRAREIVIDLRDAVIAFKAKHKLQ